MPLVSNGRDRTLDEDRELRQIQIARPMFARIPQQLAEPPAFAERTGTLLERLRTQPQAIHPLQTPVVRRGLMDAFVKTCQRWRLSEQEQIILLGYRENEFLGAKLLNGRFLHPPQDVRDRAAYILSISVGLGAVFDESINAE